MYGLQYVTVDYNRLQQVPYWFQQRQEQTWFKRIPGISIESIKKNSANSLLPITTLFHSGSRKQQTTPQTISCMCCRYSSLSCDTISDQQKQFKFVYKENPLVAASNNSCLLKTAIAKVHSGPCTARLKSCLMKVHNSFYTLTHLRQRSYISAYGEAVPKLVAYVFKQTVVQKYTYQY